MTKKLTLSLILFFMSLGISFAQEGNCDIWYNSDSVNFDPHFNTLQERWPDYKSLGLFLDSCIINKTMPYKTHWKLFINSEGKVIDAKPIENVGECEGNIIYHLKMMPSFIPAKIDNRSVCCTFILTLARY